VLPEAPKDQSNEQERGGRVGLSSPSITHHSHHLRLKRHRDIKKYFAQEIFCSRNFTQKNTKKKLRIEISKRMYNQSLFNFQAGSAS
jgi:hypothetical protein